MSTALTAAEDTHSGRHGEEAPEGLSALGNPEERGTLTVDDRVVERVAGHAVTLVEGAGAAPRRVLGLTVAEAKADSEPSVTARVDGRVATIDATVAIGWPASVRSVGAELRRRVREDVERMTGVRVAHVDLDVVSLSLPKTQRRRVL